MMAFESSFEADLMPRGGCGRLKNHENTHSFRPFLVFLLALPVPAQGHRPRLPPRETPHRIILRAIFDFGERESTEVVEHNYVIRNEGEVSLEITSVRASCGCTAVKPSQNVIAPGAEGTIQARFDLRGRNGMQIKTITVNSNDPKTPVLNLAEGSIVNALRAQPSTLFSTHRTRRGTPPYRRDHFRQPHRVGAARPIRLVVTIAAEPGVDGTAPVWWRDPPPRRQHQRSLITVSTWRSAGIRYPWQPCGRARPGPAENRPPRLNESRRFHRRGESTGCYISVRWRWPSSWDHRNCSPSPRRRTSWKLFHIERTRHSVVRRVCACGFGFRHGRKRREPEL